MTERLPDGVYRLSDESAEILRRVAEKRAETTARHLKRAS